MDVRLHYKDFELLEKPRHGTNTYTDGEITSGTGTSMLGDLNFSGQVLSNEDDRLARLGILYNINNGLVDSPNNGLVDIAPTTALWT